MFCYFVFFVVKIIHFKNNSLIILNAFFYFCRECSCNNNERNFCTYICNALVSTRNNSPILICLIPIVLRTRQTASNAF